MFDKGSRDLKACALLWALSFLQFLPGWLKGLTPFWGDLTYLHQPWRALPAQLLQGGRLPLWNPYLYFGMPMAAQMQAGVFYPGTIPFYFFDFSSALALFHGCQYGLAATLMYLWLRRNFSPAAALSGAAVFVLGGGMMSRAPFLNHLAVLSLVPAYFLFFNRPGLLALTLSCSFFAGYPPFLVGSVAGVWALRLMRIFSREEPRLSYSGRGWLAAGCLAAMVSACLLLPALELSLLSRRSAGFGLSESLRFGYGLRDLAQWISPLLVSGRNLAVEWWKCSYIGFSGWIAAGLGLWALPRRVSAALLLLLGATALLILGESTPLSLALWAWAPPLKFVRYPGNFFYLALPALSLLAAAGAAGRKRAWLLFLCVVLELSWYGGSSRLWTRRDIFASPGPMVRTLQEKLGEGRYLLSPRALESTQGRGIDDWKFRLYGLTNAPFRLRSAGNFGEPLVPRASYRFMDALYSASGAQKAAELFPWGGIGLLLTAEKLPPSDSLRHEGSSLWQMYRYSGPRAMAYGFSREDGEKIPAGLPLGAAAVGAPLAYRSPREDRFVVEGNFSARGWAFVSEPRYPGWKIILETPAGRGRAESVAAMEAFQKVEVPAGPWRLWFHYDPPLWKAGRLLTVLGLMGFALYWYNRLRIAHATP